MLIILGVLILSGCAHSDAWTTRDTIGQVLVTAVLAADAVTTNRIQDHPGYYEAGPVAQQVLGLHPRTHSTYQYFAINMVANYLVARALPAKWRPYWQGWEITVHGYAVYNNCSMDLC
jgi:hypothetical protein